MTWRILSRLGALFHCSNTPYNSYSRSIRCGKKYIAILCLHHPMGSDAYSQRLPPFVIHDTVRAQSYQSQDSTSRCLGSYNGPSRAKALGRNLICHQVLPSTTPAFASLVSWKVALGWKRTSYPPRLAEEVWATPNPPGMAVGSFHR